MDKRSIYDKIEAKAQSDASSILADARLDALKKENEIIDDMNERIANLERVQEAKLADELRSVKTKLASEEKSALLALKKQLIEEVKEKAVLKLVSMNDADFKAFVVAALKNNSFKGNEMIATTEADLAKFKKIFGENLEKLNREFNANFSLSESFAQIRGGFILVGDAFDIDCSYEALCADLVAEEEKAIASILFSGD